MKRASISPCKLSNISAGFTSNFLTVAIEGNVQTWTCWATQLAIGMGMGLALSVALARNWLAGFQLLVCRGSVPSLTMLK